MCMCMRRDIIIRQHTQARSRRSTAHRNATQAAQKRSLDLLVLLLLLLLREPEGNAPIRRPTDPPADPPTGTHARSAHTRHLYFWKKLGSGSVALSSPAAAPPCSAAWADPGGAL